MKVVTVSNKSVFRKGLIDSIAKKQRMYLRECNEQKTNSITAMPLLRRQAFQTRDTIFKIKYILTHVSEMSSML